VIDLQLLAHWFTGKTMKAAAELAETLGR